MEVMALMQDSLKVLHQSVGGQRFRRSNAAAEAAAAEGKDKGGGRGGGGGGATTAATGEEHLHLFQK